MCCRTWEQLLKLHSADAVFKGTVTGVNKGGAIVLVDGLRAFLPGSHLSGVYADDSLVGQELPLKFLEVRRQEQEREHRPEAAGWWGEGGTREGEPGV